MIYLFIVISLCLCQLVLADIQYNVVYHDDLEDGNSLAVKVDRSTIVLLHSDDSLPMLYKATAPSSHSTYRYVVVSTANPQEIISEEEFDRTLTNAFADRTLNDVYGQDWHVWDESKPLPQLYSFNKDSTGRMSDPVASHLFQEGTIATVHLSAPEEDVAYLHANKMDKKFKLKGTLTYINHDSIQQFEDVSFKVSGHSSRYWTKVPYGLKISRKTYPDGLYRRWNLKLRSEVTDPTMVREKLYNDVLQSTGVMAARGAYVRLYINGEAIGLFLLVDDPSSKSFIREVVYGGENNPNIGTLIKADGSKGKGHADLDYLGDDPSLYDSKTYQIKADSVDEEGESVGSKDLISFSKLIKEHDPESLPNDERAIKFWDEHMDISRYLRQMAVEYIAGNWDGHQYSGNNYILFRGSDNNKFVFIPLDFDYTFGNGLEEDQLHLLTGTTEDMLKHRPVRSQLWTKMRETPYIMTVYKQIVADINKHVTRPDILNAHIDSLAEMIEESVNWDRSLQTKTIGKEAPWTVNNYWASFEKGEPSRVDSLIGLKQWVKIKYDSIIRHNETDSG